MDEQEDTTTEVGTVADITPDRLASLGFGVRTTEPKPKKVKGDKANSGSRGRTPLPGDQLRRSQLRALAVLAECEADNGGAAITLFQIAKKAKVSEQTIKQGLGAINPNEREEHDKIYGYKSLLSRGLIIVTDVEGEHRYYLSVTGQHKVSDLEEELKGIKDTKPNSAGVDKRTGPKARKSENKKVTKRPPKRTKTNVENVDQLP